MKVYFDVSRYCSLSHPPSLSNNTHCLYSSVNLRVAAALPDLDELNMAAW